jgi:hypothetical protein
VESKKSLEYGLIQMYYIMQLCSCWLCLMGTLNGFVPEHVSGAGAERKMERSGPKS